MMTNKEKYQRTFSALHASGQFKEVKDMKATSKHCLPRAAAICAAIILVMGLASVAYAADIGGIQRMIQIWRNGDQTDAVLEIQDGNYALDYVDAEGQTHHVIGGGIGIDPYGNERPLTEAEIMDHLNRPEVEYKEDGTVWVYYRDQKIEITDKFDEDGVCYLLVTDGEDSQYLTIKYQNGFGSHPNRFPDPNAFNITKEP